MPKFLIERDVPDAGRLTATELRAISLQLFGVLRELGPDVMWLYSYITDDKFYCLYIGPNEELMREHARLSGFPATHVMVVKRIIDPTTAESGRSEHQ